MKKTFENIRTLAALLIASAAFTACSNEDSDITSKQPAAEQGSQVYTLTLQAGKAEASQTRALALDGTDLKASWEDGDQLQVMNGNTAVGFLTASNISTDGQTATFSGSLSGTVAVDDVLTLTYHPVGALTDYTSQDGTLASASDYDVATATVTVASVSDANEITISESEATFETQTAVLKITMQDANGNAINATYLEVSATVPGVGTQQFFDFAVSADAYTDNGEGILYFALPSQSAVESAHSMTTGALTSLSVTFTAALGTSGIYTATKAGYTLEAGNYYATVLTMENMAEAPAGVEAVDLGLPSGTKWASMNIGAESETEYGDYFAWGETEPYYSSLSPLTWKDGKSAGYAWDSYRFTTDLGSSFTKYTGSYTGGDGNTVLQSTDDAAAVNWGGDWRMPTVEDFRELFSETDNEWVADFNSTGVSGYKFTNKTDATKYIFLPAAGSFHGTTLEYGTTMSIGYYWTSTLGGAEYYPNGANYVHMFNILDVQGNTSTLDYYASREIGSTVRPVQSN